MPFALWIPVELALPELSGTSGRSDWGWRYDLPLRGAGHIHHFRSPELKNSYFQPPPNALGSL